MNWSFRPADVPLRDLSMRAGSAQLDGRRPIHDEVIGVNAWTGAALNIISPRGRPGHRWSKVFSTFSVRGNSRDERGDPPACRRSGAQEARCARALLLPSALCGDDLHCRRLDNVVATRASFLPGV